MLRRIACLLGVLAIPLAALPVGAGEIHRAIEAGDAARVAELIRANPQVIHERDTNPFQDFPMHTAASAGQVEIARMLLDAGAVLDAEDTDASTPLHNACVTRHAEMVAFLLERGASVTRRDRNGAYALSFAAAGGDTAVVRMVLEAGADLFHRSPTGVSLLHFAALRNLTALADTLLAHGEDVNARTAQGETPLVWAVVRDQLDMAEKLLAHGARPGLGNEHGETPLHSAAARGNLEMGRLLLAWGANPNQGTGRGWDPRPLHYTCFATGPGRPQLQHQAEFARLLLAHGADPNDHTGGDYAINMAAGNGLTDVVAALLESGAQTEVPEDQFGCLPLHIAALRGYPEIARLLLDRGAQVGAKNARGETAFDLAACYGQRDVAELLLARGAAGRLPGTDQGLAAFADLAEKEAVVWFLEHSGWAVKTSNHLLVFDYYESRPAPVHAGLCNGTINPAELAGENVMVFASHEHGDHYSPVIWTWREQLPEATYVLGFEPTPARPGQPQVATPPHEFVGPRQTRTIDGVTITTIESNDTGVGFWVQVDGLTIFHAGDHANRSRDWSTPFKEEIDWLAAKNARPDIAFFPISGCGFGDQEAVKMGVYYALETLEPRVFFPMHSGDMNTRYQTFVQECRGRFPKTRMEAAAIKGDRFHYSKGAIAALASRAD